MATLSMQQAIQAYLSKSRFKSDIQAMQIEAIWEEVMGKTIAKYTEKIELVQGKLFITTAVAPLKHELLYQKNNIQQRVNEAVGERIVKEVIIR